MFSIKEETFYLSFMIFYALLFAATLGKPRRAKVEKVPKREPFGKGDRVPIQQQNIRTTRSGLAEPIKTYQRYSTPKAPPIANKAKLPEWTTERTKEFKEITDKVAQIFSFDGRSINLRLEFDFTKPSHQRIANTRFESFKSFLEAYNRKTEANLKELNARLETDFQQNGHNSAATKLQFKEKQNQIREYYEGSIYNILKFLDGKVIYDFATSKKIEKITKEQMNPDYVALITPNLKSVDPTMSHATIVDRLYRSYEIYYNYMQKNANIPKSGKNALKDFAAIRQEQVAISDFFKQRALGH